MADKTPVNKAAIWKNRFDTAEDNQQKLFEDAQKYYDILYAVFNTKNMAPWRSKVYVPVLASKAWDLISRLSDIVPEFDVAIKNELTYDEESQQILQADGVSQRERMIKAKLHYDYKHGDTPMKLRVFEPLIDAVCAGTGYAAVPWRLSTDKSYARPFDPETGDITDEENIVEKTMESGCNGFEGINFFNVFVAPGSTDFWSAPYIIVRGFKPLVDMEGAGIYENLARVNTTVKKNQFDLFNQARNRSVNQNTQEVDDTVDMVTYYECYERTSKGIQLTTYAEGEDPEDGWVTIRPASYPYWHNMYPVVPFYTRRKSFSPFGESLFENNRTLQSATNDLFNHYLDNWNLSIDAMLMYEDGTLTNDFVIEPGGEITYTGTEPKPFKFPDPDPQQLSVVMNTLSGAIEQATVPQYLSGVPNSQIDKTQGTATGVSKITEAATEKVGFMRDNFKQSMTVVGKIWLSNLQQFMSTPSEIRMSQGGKQVPGLLMPGDVQGEIDLEIDDDSMTPVSKSDQRDMVTAFIAQAITLQNQAMTQAQVFHTPEDVPRYNFVEMADDLARLYSVKSSDRYLLDSKQAIAAAAAASQQQASTPTKPPIENINYKDAPPDVQAQMEAQAGLQPSSLHGENLQTQAMQHGATQHQILNPPEVTNGQPNQAGTPSGTAT